MSRGKSILVKLLILPIFLVLSNTFMWADISGTVFRDFNLNGVQESTEPGIAGLSVSAYDDNGISNTQTTDVNGNYTLSVTGSKYRVEITNVPEYLKSGTAINGSTSAQVSMANNNTVHNVGLYNTGQYCQANPDIILTRFTKEERDGVNIGTSSLLTFPYTANGTDAPTDISNYADVGAVYGVAHLKKYNMTYVSSYLKRHADLGPAGIGAIYKIDHSNGNAVSTFATLPGIDPRNAGVGYDWDHDTLGYTKVGKTGLGDIEISDDENKLFAVNLEDRKLYVMNVNTNGNTAGTSSYTIPNPCVNEIDFRPMGLGFRDGLLYVGVTCTAESTVNPNDINDSYDGPRKGDKSQLSAHVYSFSPVLNTFSATSLVNIDLSYGRGCIYNGNISTVIPPAGCAQLADKDGIPRPFIADWNPWQMDYDIVFNDKKPGNIGNQDGWIEYMQPLLSDIEFDNDGSMVIQIRDINGDRGGYQNHSPNPADVTRQNTNGEGDIIKACGNPQIGWTLENNGQCGGITTAGANNGEGLGGGEFYWNDNGPGGTNHSSIGFTGTGGHSATAMGGLLIVPGHQELITGAIDVHNILDNGLLWLRNDTGELAKDSSNEPKRLLVSEVDITKYYGKAGGIGDIEALCEAPPVEIGNYVWEDTDGDGVQDPNEAALVGVVVQLFEGGVLVGTATTNSSGHYYFGGTAHSNMNNADPLKINTAYQIKIALNDAALGGNIPTLQNTTTDSSDSDGDYGNIDSTASTIEYTTGNAGDNNHTLDFGFVLPEPSIDIEKSTNTIDADTADEAVYLSTGDTVTWGYVITNNANETLTQINATDDKEGAIVCPKTTLFPEESMVCTAKTGIAGSTDYENKATVTAQGQTSTTVVTDSDMSHYRVIYHIGTHFWIDSDKDGIFDVDEIPIDGALVELFDANGTKIDETTTANGGEYGFDVAAGSYYVQFHIPDRPEYEGYVFSKPNTNKDNSLNINQANNGGFTQSVTVGPGHKTEDLTLDAGINCGCANVSTDSANAQSLISILAMIFFSLMTVFYFVRREEEKETQNI